MIDKLIRLRWQTLIIITFCCAGCGFHLRGDLELPAKLDHIAMIVHAAHREIAPLIREQLRAYHRDVVEDPAAAKYWLIIEADSLTQNITGISSSTTPRQYELIYTVEFKLQSVHASDSTGSQKIFVSRAFTANSDRILGSNDEQAHLTQEMRQNAAIMILDRLGTIAK